MVFVADGSYIEEDVYRSEGLKLWTEQRILGCTGLRAVESLNKSASTSS